MPGKNKGGRPRTLPTGSERFSVRLAPVATTYITSEANRRGVPASQVAREIFTIGLQQHSLRTSKTETHEQKRPQKQRFTMKSTDDPPTHQEGV